MSKLLKVNGVSLNLVLLALSVALAILAGQAILHRLPPCFCPPSH
ncbi:hypothetical protein CupriaWKF_02900 [Cupriavidus sp. WKF15]|nr:hypothetical protein [Cupriavidus sp. WKF15]WER46555.1 hypothetical protein CupriaWKF_02900 [Cupriavidus sp. WKF15]